MGCGLGLKYKQVILVRTDLGMSIGKTAAQVAHGAVSAAEAARIGWMEWWSGWMDEGQCKIVLRVKSEEELLRFDEMAGREGLPKALVVDKGLTEVAPGTVTCLAIGPAPSDKVDKLTGVLPLL
jgi:PTH2 family peptidyl-tRNA hydrolase